MQFEDVLKDGINVMKDGVGATVPEMDLENV